MGNMLLAMLFLSFSFMSFRYSYAYMGAYRAFYGLYSDEIELYVVNLTNNGVEQLPYFSVHKVKDYVQDYLGQRLAKACDYEALVEGFEYRDDEEKYPMGVSVRLYCSLLDATILDKTALFTLVEESDE